MEKLSPFSAIRQFKREKDSARTLSIQRISKVKLQKQILDADADTENFINPIVLSNLHTNLQSHEYVQ